MKKINWWSVGLVICFILLGIIFFVNCQKAMAINQPPCCDVADIAPVEDIEVPQVEHSRSSSGSYIKKAVAPYTILKFGDRGEEVKQFQMVLNEFGKANLKVDGIFGKLTLKAWEDYKLVMWSIQNGSLN